METSDILFAESFGACWFKCMWNLQSQFGVPPLPPTHPSIARDSITEGCPPRLHYLIDLHAKSCRCEAKSMSHMSIKYFTSSSSSDGLNTLGGPFSELSECHSTTREGWKKVSCTNPLLSSCSFRCQQLLKRHEVPHQSTLQSCNVPGL